MTNYKWPAKGLAFFLLCLIVFGCQQDLHAPVKVSTSKVEATIPCFPWDWDAGTGADYLPSPPNTQILSPWAGNASALYDQNIRFDFHKADGWKLEYNNFNTTAIPSAGFFALYNQYRGILRFYWYLPGTKVPVGSTSTEQLITYGSGSSSFLNFTNSMIIDAGSNTMSTDNLTHYGVPALGDNWFVTQYEVGYDYTLPTKSYTNTWLNFSMPFYNIESMTLGGPITGTATGTITSPSGGLGGSLGSLIGGAAQGVGGLLLTKNDLLDANGPGKDILVGTISGLLTGGASSVATGLGSAVVGLLSSESSQSQVNLYYNLTAQLKGDIHSTGSLLQNNMINIPGTPDATIAPGVVPVDNKVLGIFNLPVKPIIKVKSTLHSGNPCPDPDVTSPIKTYYSYVSTLDPTTLAYLNSANQQSFNPAVLSVADIGPIHYDILGAPVDACGNSVAEETIGGLPLSNWGTNDVISRTKFSSGTLYLRVYFDVIPKNGGKKVTIVKTFKATGVAG